MSSQEKSSQFEEANELIGFLVASPSFNSESCLLILELLRRKIILLNPMMSFVPGITAENQPAKPIRLVKEWEKIAIERALTKLNALSSKINDQALAAPPSKDDEGEEAASRRKLEEIVLRIEETPPTLAVDPLELVAAIISETYAEAGEDAVIADDEALLMIRDLILDNDPDSIERNRGRCISAKVRSWDAVAATY
jgi:hypothetical protein